MAGTARNPRLPACPITLPLSEILDQVQDLREQGMTEGKGTRLDTRILVIDDEPLLLRATSRLLTKAGYEVIEAATGREGLRSGIHSEQD